MLRKASDICQRAAELVATSREATHGPKLENHRKIAAMWNAFLAIRRDEGPLTAEDVALMMACLKIARTQLGDYNGDDYVDLAGYAGVAGEIAAAEVGPSSEE